MREKTMPDWWPTSGRVAHVYWVPELDAEPDLNRLLQQGRTVLDAVDYINPVPREWLHMTMAMIGDLGVDRVAIADAVQTAASNISSFDIVFGSHMVTRSAVMLDTYEPSGRLQHLSDAIMGALQTVTDTAEPPGGPHHMTTAYGTRTGPADEPTGSLLRHACIPSHAKATITALKVVDVDARRAAVEQTYAWDTIATIPLGRQS